MGWILLYSFIANGVMNSMMYATAQEHRGKTIINTVVYSCSCKGCRCNFVINAIGDLRDIAITTIAHNLGMINKPTDIIMQSPPLGEQKLYTLTTTEAYSNNLLDKEIVGKPMLVLFMAEKPDDEVLKSEPQAIGVTHVYRKLYKESLWTLVATLAHISLAAFTEVWNMRINQNGDVFWSNFQDPDINLGKAILN